MPDQNLVEGPFFKDWDKYLNPSDWHGDPVPVDRIGPWGLNQTCYWYRLTRPDGGRRVFAAETAERARAALDAYLAE